MRCVVYHPRYIVKPRPAPPVYATSVAVIRLGFVPPFLSYPKWRTYINIKLIEFYNTTFYQQTRLRAFHSCHLLFPFFAIAYNRRRRRRSSQTGCSFFMEPIFPSSVFSGRLNNYQIERESEYVSERESMRFVPFRVY